MFSDGWRAIRKWLPFAVRTADSCIVCRCPVEGRYLKDAFGNCVCAGHEKSTTRCRWCARLLPRGSACSVCADAAVIDPQRAQRIFEEIAEWCSRQGLSFDSKKVAFKLGGQVAGAGGSTDRHRLGVTQSHRNVRDAALQRVTVSVVRGMPEPLFRSVVAHECAHVWTAIQGVHQTHVAEEGFAEVVSRRYLKTRPGRDYAVLSERLAQNPDPVYGSGFRSVQATVDHRGFHWYIRFLQAG